MAWDRAAAPEYDTWEQLGNPGWNWNNMINKMLQVDNFTGANTQYYGSAGVGFTGPINSAIFPPRHPQQRLWIPTVETFGIPNNLESLDGHPIGVQFGPNNVDPSSLRRSYSANEYLPRARPNLHVMINTTVAKVNFRRWGRELVATGVTLPDNVILSARKEVIVAAGALLAPTVLERSGIGQRAVLDEAGITPLLDLPGVGENLQDHVLVSNSYRLKPNYTSAAKLKYNATYAAEQMALYDAGNSSSDYAFTGDVFYFGNWDQTTGNSSSSIDLTALARAAIGNSTNPVDRIKLSYLTTNLKNDVPQVEVIFSNGLTTTAKGYPSTNSSLYGSDFFTLIGAMQHPLSRGSVHINTSSPNANPLIDPNYLSSEYDVHGLAEILKFNRRAAFASPLRDTWLEEYEPGLNVTTDEQLREYAIDTARTVWHPVGTCAMLPLRDGGVVDPELRVYGTRNLRVVDASVIPVLISAHIQTAVYGIAERAADMVVDQWSGRRRCEWWGMRRCEWNGHQ